VIGAAIDALLFDEQCRRMLRATTVVQRQSGSVFAVYGVPGRIVLSRSL
jgi:hypothetical protein